MKPGHVHTFCLGIVSVACSAPASDEAPDFSPSATTGSAAASPGVDGSEGGAAPAAGLGFVEEASGELLDSTCGGFSVEPERLPLDMFFLVDSSGSMAEPAAAGADKWSLVTRALIDFLSEPDTSTIGVGINYFPQGVTPACSQGQAGCLCIPVINLCFATLGGSCAASDYATPAVPLASPSIPSRLIDDIGSRQLGGGTPTRAALEGTYRYLDSWTALHPGRKVVAVLATDGEPTGCDENGAEDVAELAAAALSGPSRIQTFVIGVGRALANLDRVARAGGTGRAYLTDASSDLASEFGAALDAIRSSAGPCAFEIPESSVEGAVDATQVNVRITPNDAAAPTLVPKTFAGSADNCGPDGGWYYDDPLSPTRIELCETSCQAAASARVEVQFGCDTVIAPR